MMKTIWLSHIISPDTPLYGGGSGILISPDKQISKEDSCNTSMLQIPSHAGTHLDVPYHFFEDKQKLDEYAAGDFIFDHPFVCSIPAEPGQLIEEKDLGEQIPEQSDLILFRTGFSQHRAEPIYWEASPGLSPDLGNTLKTMCPNLKAVGMDFISISSLKNRSLGRKAHQQFLGRDILLIEDMDLSMIPKSDTLEKVIAAPLRFVSGDGAPCTVMGFI